MLFFFHRNIKKPKCFSIDNNNNQGAIWGGGGISPPLVYASLPLLNYFYTGPWSNVPIWIKWFAIHSLKSRPKSSDSQYTLWSPDLNQCLAFQKKNTSQNLHDTTSFLFDLSWKAFDMSVECNFVLSRGFKDTKHTLCEEAPEANVYDQVWSNHYSSWVLKIQLKHKLAFVIQSKQCNQSENQHCLINWPFPMSMKDFISLCHTFSQSELVWGSVANWESPTDDRA